MPWYEVLMALVPAVTIWCLSGAIAISAVDGDTVLLDLINTSSFFFDSLLWEFFVVMVVLSFWPLIVDAYGTYKFLKWFIGLSFWGSPRDPDTIYQPMHVEYPEILSNVRFNITPQYHSDRLYPCARIPNV